MNDAPASSDPTTSPSPAEVVGEGSPPGEAGLDDAAGTVATRPRTIRDAVVLMYVGAAHALLTISFPFVAADAARTQALDEGRLTAEEIDAVITMTQVTSVVVGLVTAALWVLNAVFNARGRSWARVLSSILAVLALAFLLATLGTATTAAAVSAVLPVALGAAVVWLLWRPDSTRYYRARSA